jgi:putative ABC transport system substrate-binding protein
VRRRDFIAGLGAAALPRGARAQQSDRVRRVAVLVDIAEDDPETQSRLAALRRGLAARGWIEGGNLRLEYTFANGNADRVRSAAVQVVNSAPDMIFANGTSVVTALKQVTRNIPIIFAVVNDPVSQGFIDSLAHPGGNITGFTFVEFTMFGKWLSILQTASPGVQHSAVMFNPRTSPYFFAYLRSYEASKAPMMPAPVDDPSQIDSIFAALSRAPGGSVMIAPDAFAVVHRGAMIEAANRYVLPAITAYRQFVREGCLLSYGPDTNDVFERSAAYVDRVLKGESPADLPAQSPVKFELAINLKTANALGITVPETLLATADEVIQ